MKKGINRHVFDTLDSTNTKLLELAEQGAGHGTLVVADRQTAGRGRLGRVWQSPAKKNIYASLLVCPETELMRIPQLSIVAGLAMRDTVKHCIPDRAVGVKWPNDVRVGQHKISGILCEIASGHKSRAVIGFGLNVNMEPSDFQPELWDIATSLLIETGRTWSRKKLLDEFLARFENDYSVWLASGDLSPFIERWRSASVLINTGITIMRGGQKLEGTAKGISAQGALLLELPAGNLVEINSGEAELIPVRGQTK